MNKNQLLNEAGFLTKRQIKLHRKHCYKAVFLQNDYVISSCTIISGVFNTIHFSKYVSIFQLGLDESSMCVLPSFLSNTRCKKYKRNGDTYCNCTAGSVSGDHNH